jgi:hypothetical protein
VKRSLFIILGVVAAAGLLFTTAFFAANRFCVARAMPTDDLAWLKQEFRLSDAEMARIKTLHEGYLPKCEAMCQKIAAKKQELDSIVTGGTNISAMTEKKLAELGELRAQCQAQMMQHFAEVSQAMPPEQGRRYFVQMTRLTLGTHEQVEKNMAAPTENAHGAH